MLYPKNIYMSPRNAIARFRTLIQKYGPEHVEKSGNLKVEKELVVAGSFLLGLQKLTGYKYYIRPGEDISANIDVRAITWGADNNSFEELDIQITEFEQHNSDLLGVIQKKILKQAQHGIEKRHLIVNIREHDGHKFYPAKIAKAVEALNPSFSSIWVLMDDYENQWQYHAIRIWPMPKIVEISYNLDAEFKNQTPPDYIRLSRGARNEVISPLYDFELPLE